MEADQSSAPSPAMGDGKHGRSAWQTDETDVFALLRGAQLEQAAAPADLERSWRLFTTMGKAQRDTLETLTGVPHALWRRMENASWRLWGLHQARSASARKTRRAIGCERRAGATPQTHSTIKRRARMLKVARTPIRPTGSPRRIVVAAASAAPARAAAAAVAEWRRASRELPAAQPLPVVPPSEQRAVAVANARLRAHLSARIAVLETAPAPPLALATAGLGAGAVAGMAARAIVHPLDTLRVLEAVSSSSGALTLRQSAAILYRGFGFSFLGAAPVYGLYFAAYEGAKTATRALAGPDGSPVAATLGAGFMAECCAATVWVPWDVIRQRIQLGAHSAAPPRGALAAAADVVGSGGVRALYTGVGEYMMLWGAFSPLMFVLYEQGISILQGGDESTDAPPSLGKSFIVGCGAGAAASLATSPLDLVKTRIQCWEVGSPMRYRNMAHGLAEVVRTEGPRALFRGAVPRALNMGLSVGIMFAAYSTARATLLRRHGYSAAPAADGQGFGGLVAPGAPLRRPACHDG